MMSFEEFRKKSHIIMDKPLFTHVFNKINDKWFIHSISRNHYNYIGSEESFLSDEEAYDYYVERMESFGFKRFEIISE